MKELPELKEIPSGSKDVPRFSPEKEKNKMMGLLSHQAECLRREGVPVTDDCRIDMSAFDKVYRELEFDKSEVVRYGNMFANVFHDGSEISSGEKLEMLKTIIMNKFIGKNFIVARSAAFDDLKNKIDNVILERSTGNLVCAVDDVREDAGNRKAEKEKRLFDRLREGKGNVLKYALSISTRGEVGAGKKIFDIPVFHLALSRREIDEATARMSAVPDELTENENAIFEKFKTALKKQIADVREEFGTNLEKISNRKIVKNILNAEEAISHM